MASIVPVTCNKDCAGSCPLLAHVEDGRIVKITNNPAGGPYLSGCVRGFQAMRVLYAPDRLTTPLIRSGPRGSGQFREATWDEALDLVAARLGEIRAQYGNEAFLPLGGSGSGGSALHNTSRLMNRFMNCFGGSTTMWGGYSSAAASFVTPYLFGTLQVGIDPATISYAKQIILWGANVADNRLGAQTAARIHAAREAGTPVIAIDPRRTRTVERFATQWIPIYPGTDSAMMLAVLYVLLREGLADLDFAARYSVGFGLLCQHVLGEDDDTPKTPEWAEQRCGTPAATIVELARTYARTKPTLLFPGLSIQRTVGGEETIRLTVAMQLATGNAGKLGGSSGGILWGRMPKPRCGALPVAARAGMPAFPVYRWPDAILEGKAGGYPSDIHAVYNVGGNYVVQGSDIQKNVRAFKKLDFAVCHDYFLTPTAQQCDVVLPVTTPFEREDIVFSDANYLLYAHKAVEPPTGTRHDYDIFCALAERLGFLDAFSEGLDAAGWLRRFLAESEVTDVEAFKRTGIYWGRDQERIGLADFYADPVAHPLKTPSGKIEIASEAYVHAGFPRTPQARLLPMDPAYPLRMVTPKSRYRTHSQNANIPWFREREPQALWIHPQDAAPRGIADGQLVEVSSTQGRVRIGAWVTEDITPGVVCLLAGMWPEFGADGVDTAGAPNVLTPTVPTTPSQGSRTHSVLVQVKAA